MEVFFIVYGALVEYVSYLSEEGRDSLKNLIYDDACHLKKFAENDVKRRNLNEYTQFMGNIPKYVDNFHFRNHTDAWCHAMCNPKDSRELDGVNTEACEQTFKWCNQFTSVKGMNESHFWFFFTVVFDMHNLHVEGRLRSIAHPQSAFRWDALKLMDCEPSLLDGQDEEVVDKDNSLTLLEDGLSGLSIGKGLPDEVSYKCDDCGAKYKKPWLLKSHMKKKHETVPEVDVYKCNECEASFDSQRNLNRHVKTHEKLFDCVECGEVFLSKSELKIHSKVHIVCKICGKPFNTDYLLKRHVKSHK